MDFSRMLARTLTSRLFVIINATYTAVGTMTFCFNPIGIARSRNRPLAAVGLLTLLLGGRVYAGTGIGDEANSALDQGKKAYLASDYSTAVQILTQAAARNLRDPEVHLWLAKSYFEMQNNDAAIASASTAAALDPKNSVYHEWLARAYGQKAEQTSWFSALSLAKKARKEFETAVNLDERNFAAQQGLIEFDCSAPSIAGGGEDKAKPEIAKVAELDQGEGYYANGNCRRQKKDFATADAQFSKALEAEPKRAELIFDIGDYAMKREQPERLLAVAETGEKVAASDPRVGFYRSVGLILKKEQLPKAEQYLRGYLKTAPVRTAYPTRAITHRWLGRLLEEKGEIQSARQEYENALKLDPKDKVSKDSVKRLGRS